MIKLGRFYHQDFLYRMGYNCGGFALGTETWYSFDHYQYRGFENSSSDKKRLRRMGKVTFLCVEQLLGDFPRQLRIIQKEEDKKSYEEVFFFRLSSDGDFHFVVKHGNKYFHKMGNTPYIDEMSKEEVYSDSWIGGYDGPLVIFAKVKKPLKDKVYFNRCDFKVLD